MKPVKNLLSNAGGSAASSSKSLAAASTAPGSRTPGGLSRRSLGPAATLPQEGGEGAGAGSLARASLALPVTEERGRGRGAYAAFLQQSGTGTNTPQDRSGHGGREAAAGAATASPTAPGASGAAAAPAEKAALPFPAGYAIHTVKAHKQQQQDKEDAAADAGGRSAIALETERGPTTPTHDAPPAAPVLVIPRDDAPTGPGTGPIAAAATGSSALAAGGPFALASRLPDLSASPAAGQGVQNPTNHGKLKQGELVSVLGMLLGDNTCQGAELHDVLRRLQFDASDSEEEVTFEQLSEGLQRLGYRLEPGELEDLLRHVGLGSSEGLTASQFIASQVDWRAFSVNHRAEWLHCLRKAFEELGGGAGPDGRVSLDTLLGSLTDKLPEEEVNLAVQESLMDAAVEADAVDFESFVRLMRCNSNDSLQSMGSSELSYDLYDPRIKDPSVHGPAHGEGLHAYHPALETVPDSDAADD